MTDPPRRPLTLSDAMLLVAATAPGLLLLRVAARLDLFKVESQLRKPPPGRVFLEHVSVAGGCILFPMAVAVLILLFCNRRVSRREAFGEAGFVTCAAVALASILPVAYFAVGVATTPKADTVMLAVNFNNMFARLNRGAGLLIVGAWLALALTGRREPGSGWVGGLGCIIGMCFVLMYVHGEFYFLLQPFFGR